MAGGKYDRFIAGVRRMITVDRGEWTPAMLRFAHAAQELVDLYDRMTADERAYMNEITADAPLWPEEDEQ